MSLWPINRNKARHENAEAHNGTKNKRAATPISEPPQNWQGPRRPLALLNVTPLPTLRKVWSPPRTPITKKSRRAPPEGQVTPRIAKIHAVAIYAKCQVTPAHCTKLSPTLRNVRSPSRIPQSHVVVLFAKPQGVSSRCAMSGEIEASPAKQKRAGDLAISTLKREGIIHS